MPEKLAKRWGEREVRTPFSVRVKEAVRPPGPLRRRLDYAIRRIELQIQRLEKATDRFSERDKSIFTRIVEVYSRHDTPRANVLASELAEIRRMEKLITHARLALEQIVLRLRTVSELGEIVSTLAPAVGVLRSVKKGMARVSPEAEKELGQIRTLLSGIIVDAGQSTGLSINFEAANESAKKILSEAATVAEQRVKEKLPELPTAMPAVGKKAPTQT